MPGGCIEKKVFITNKECIHLLYAAGGYGSPPFFKEGTGVVLRLIHDASNTNKSNWNSLFE